MRLPSSAPLYCTTPARQECKCGIAGVWYSKCGTAGVWCSWSAVQQECSAHKGGTASGSRATQPIMKTLPVVLGLLCCVAAQVCSPRSFGYDSVVCVCNATYCDQPGIINFPEEGCFTVVTSSRDGLRFNVETFPVSSEDDLDAEEITVNREDVYHTILGFGGAFTDSTGLNVVALSSQLQEHFLRSYFAPEGIGYTIGRIPIAGCDCSTRTYSYDDVEGDDDLVHWNLTEEDHKYKIPLILRAKEMSAYPLKMFGSPWSSPAWMKTNGMFNGSGTLIYEYWQAWANYIVKFVDAYEAAGVKMWGLTPQNEPLGGLTDWKINAVGWSAESMRDWLRDNLGPTLEAAGYRRLKMMVHDFNRDSLISYIEPMLADPECAKYIDGTAVHWYSDNIISPEILDKIHALSPERFILYTEACQGWDVEGSELSVNLGSWLLAEQYVHSMLDAVNHYSTGWVDWNMALDTLGGPNWANIFLDAPVIIDAEAKEFYKQPMFYAIGHLSKFVVPGAKRISSSTSSNWLEAAAFIDPSGRTVVVVLNKDDDEEQLTVTDGSSYFLNFKIPPKAIQTILY